MDFSAEPQRRTKAPRNDGQLTIKYINIIEMLMKYYVYARLYYDITASWYNIKK